MFICGEKENGMGEAKEKIRKERITYTSTYLTTLKYNADLITECDQELSWVFTDLDLLTFLH